jgi:hypothetical protein
MTELVLKIYCILLLLVDLYCLQVEILQAGIMELNQHFQMVIFQIESRVIITFMEMMQNGSLTLIRKGEP